MNQIDILAKEAFGGGIRMFVQQVHAKAQSELDEVVGMSRLPELDDRTSLPYVEAFLQEVYR